MKRASILRLVLPLLIVALLGQTAAPAGSQEQTNPKMVTVRGKLVRVAAIGGETTGWALELDEPRQVGGKTLSRLEVDPAGKDLASLATGRIEARGSLEKRCGVGRGDYWVLKADKIQAMNK